MILPDNNKTVISGLNYSELETLFNILRDEFSITLNLNYNSEDTSETYKWFIYTDTEIITKYRLMEMNSLKNYASGFIKCYRMKADELFNKNSFN